MSPYQTECWIFAVEYQALSHHNIEPKEIKNTPHLVRVHLLGLKNLSLLRRSNYSATMMLDHLWYWYLCPYLYWYWYWYLYLDTNFRLVYQFYGNIYEPTRIEPTAVESMDSMELKQPKLLLNLDLRWKKSAYCSAQSNFVYVSQKLGYNQQLYWLWVSNSGIQVRGH